MKQLMYLMFALAIIISCNNEQDSIQENSDATINLEGINSVSDAIEAGIDIQVYLNSLPKKAIGTNERLLQREENSDLEFFYSAEDFPCAEGLPTESFDNATYYNNCAGDYLDENTDSYLFSPGDILPGISFESPYDYSCAMYLWSYTDRFDTYVLHNALYENYYYDLTINFTDGGVTSVAMDVGNWYGYSYTYIDVYGKNGYLGQGRVYVTDWRSMYYWGVVSDEPITKLVLRTSNGGLAGVDNISFGNCDDLDSDGCLNEDDAYPDSNKMEYVTIDGCNSGVTNALIDCGTFMMDEIDALIAEISAKAQEPRSRFRRAYNAQSEFNKKMYYLLGYWQSKGYITYTENREIMKCVGSADIDWENNDPR
jgi:hypothetical protein